MNVKRPVTPKIIIGDQPSEEDLLECKYEGFGGVVNLRNDGEPEQPISTSAEGDKVCAPGHGIPALWSGRRPWLTPGWPGSAISSIATPARSKVLVHCRKGGRAIALVLIQQARAGLDRGRSHREGPRDGTSSRRTAQDHGRELPRSSSLIVHPRGN